MLRVAETGGQTGRLCPKDIQEMRRLHTEDKVSYTGIGGLYGFSELETEIICTGRSIMGNWDRSRYILMRNPHDIPTGVAVFWENVNKCEGCWLWHGATNTKTGYGHFSFHSRTTLAHRVAWELTNGPIPRGLVIIRTCGNRLCCNPEHMRVVTYSEQRRLSKTTPRGESHWERKQRRGRVHMTSERVKDYVAGEQKNAITD